MSFESILASIGEEAERGQLTELAKKYPVLRERVELGERVQPVFTTLAAKGLKVDEEIARLPEWIDYRNSNWDQSRGMYKREAAAVDRAVELEAQLTEAQGKVGSELTVEEMEAQLKARGVVFKDDLKTVVTQDGLNASMGAMTGRFQEIFVALTPQATEHAKRFGEPIPMDQVMAYIEKTGERDPVKAYQAVIAPKEMELKHKADVEAARADERKKATEELQAKYAERGITPMPAGSGAGTKPTSFMRRILGARAERAAQGTTGRLGDGTAARAGVEDYNKRMAGVGSV